MRPELDFNDPYIAGERQRRLERLGQSPEEHTYLHKTLDEAVADQQRHSHPILVINSIVISVALIAVILIVLLRP